MVKRLIFILFFVFTFCGAPFALSDSEFLKFKKDSDFREADKELNQAYKEAQSLMPQSDFEKIKRQQIQWIKSGRDDDAKKFLKTGDYSKTEAYTLATRRRAREIYGKIPCDLGLVDIDDFIGDYYDDENYLCLSISRDKNKKKNLCVSINEPRKNSPDMFGSPKGNILEAEFDYNDEDLMNILKYENGIDEDEDLDLSVKITMLGKNKIKVEASQDLNQLFNASGIFIRKIKIN